MPVGGVEEQGGPWRRKFSSVLKILMALSWTPKWTRGPFFQTCSISNLRAEGAEV